jgi:hypothetical protein
MNKNDDEICCVQKANVLRRTDLFSIKLSSEQDMSGIAQSNVFQGGC